MVKVRDSILFPALIILLIAIPAASQTVNIKQDEGYRGVIDSEFSDVFEVDFDPGKMFMELKQSEARLQVNQSFRKRVVMLQTSEGYVKKTQTNDSIVKVVQTPYGRFETGVRSGENFSSFDGDQRSKAEELRNRLEDKFSEKVKESQDRKRVVMDRILPDVELDVRVESPEHFNLTNTGEDKISLQDWVVMSEGSNKYTYELEGSIEPGETRSYYSSTGYSDRDNTVDGTDMTLYNSGGEVVLYNSQERVIDSFEN
jgi:hypothetical protein